MAVGTVKWFSQEKGFGFVDPDGADEDLFIHFTTVQLEAFHGLTDGARITFEVVEGERGPQASNVGLAP